MCDINLNRYQLNNYCEFVISALKLHEKCVKFVETLLFNSYSSQYQLLMYDVLKDGINQNKIEAVRVLHTFHYCMCIAL